MPQLMDCNHVELITLQSPFFATFTLAILAKYPNVFIRFR